MTVGNNLISDSGMLDAGLGLIQSGPGIQHLSNSFLILILLGEDVRQLAFFARVQQDDYFFELLAH